MTHDPRCSSSSSSQVQVVAGERHPVPGTVGLPAAPSAAHQAGHGPAGAPQTPLLLRAGGPRGQGGQGGQRGQGGEGHLVLGREGNPTLSLSISMLPFRRHFYPKRISTVNLPFSIIRISFIAFVFFYKQGMCFCEIGEHSTEINNIEILKNVSIYIKHNQFKGANVHVTQ